MELVSFEPEHLLDIDPPVMNPEEMRFFAACYESQGPAYTGLEDRTVIGCAGVAIDGKTGRVWAVLSDRIRNKPFALHRAVRREMEKIIEQHELECLEATCHAQFMTAQKWLERLGFRLVNSEALLGGQTYLGYVRES